MTLTKYEVLNLIKEANNTNDEAEQYDILSMLQENRNRNYAIHYSKKTNKYWIQFF